MASGPEGFCPGGGNAEGYKDRKVNRDREKKEQEDIEEEIYSLPAQRASRPAGGTIFWFEPHT